MRKCMVMAMLLAGMAGCSADRGSAAASVQARETASKHAAPAFMRARSAVGAFPDRGELLVYERKQSPSSARGGYVSFPVQLSEAHAIKAIATGELRVTTPDGQLLRLRYARHVEHPDGNWTWIGRLPGAESDEAILTFGEHAVFGSIPQGGDRPPLRLTMAGGRTWVVEPGPRLVAVLADGRKSASNRDYFVPPRLRSQPHAVASMQAAGDTGDKATTTVDVLIGYTPGFRDSLGGDSQARTRLTFLVDVGNLALANSQLDVRWRLVHAMLVSYPDATDNGAALEQLTGFRAPSTQIPPGPEFAALRAARGQYGADLVTLVRRFQRPENNGCGIAWLIGGGQSAIGAGSDYFGYSVVSDGRETEGSTTYFCRDETMAHEMGHNMGSQHDVATARGDDGVLGSDEYGRYPYSFGYKTTPATGDFFTVMAYGDSGQTPNRIFSNPRVTICGPAPGGRACGLENEADNARSLGQTAPSIAAFRAAVVVPPGGGDRVHNDMNADGKSDLVWVQNPNVQMVFWYMNGATIAGTSGQNTAVDAAVDRAALIGSGDLDGNGVTDLVYMGPNSGKVFVRLYAPVGSYVEKLVLTPGSSWKLAGTGDVNGDGKDDLLWHRPASGQFAYWLMNGGTIAGSSGFASPAGYAAIGTGDLDGNGRVDAIWRDATGRVVVWLGQANGTYLSSYVYTLATSWTLVGTGDVNGDGKDDLLWSRPSSGQFVYWTMNGATLAGSSAFAISGTFTAIGTGDFDGNGRVDIVWRNASGQIYFWLGQAAGNYTVPYVYALSGWTLLR